MRQADCVQVPCVHHPHLSGPPFRRACQASYIRKQEIAAREFRTEIERAEFSAVDWVDEYQSAIKRKDLSGRSALDHATRRCFVDIEKCLQASITRCAAALVCRHSGRCVLDAWLPLGCSTQPLVPLPCPSLSQDRAPT